MLHICNDFPIIISCTLISNNLFDYHITQMQLPKISKISYKYEWCLPLCKIERISYQQYEWRVPFDFYKIRRSFINMNSLCNHL